MLVPLEKPNFSVRFSTTDEDNIKQAIGNIKAIRDKLYNFINEAPKAVGFMQINQHTALGIAERAKMKDVRKSMLALGKLLDEIDKEIELTVQALRETNRYIK